MGCYRIGSKGGRLWNSLPVSVETNYWIRQSGSVGCLLGKWLTYLT